MTADFLSVIAKPQKDMVNQISIKRRSSLSLSLNISSVLIAIAVGAAIGSFTAILLQSDIFTYLCATVALAAVYTLERINPKHPEGGEL